MSPELSTGLRRGIIAGAGLALPIFFTLLGQGASWQAIVSATGLAFFGTGGFFAAFGQYDKGQAEKPGTTQAASRAVAEESKP